MKECRSPNGDGDDWRPGTIERHTREKQINLWKTYGRRRRVGGQVARSHLDALESTASVAVDNTIRTGSANAAVEDRVAGAGEVPGAS